MKNNTPFSYIIICIAYLLAIFAGKISLELINTNNIYTDMLVADIIATLVIFIFSLLFQNSSMYDPYWSIIPVPIAYFWIQMNPEGNSVRQAIILGVILVWSFRLTLNWIKSWTNLNHEDWRYKKLAEDSGRLYWPVSFLGIHLFPTILVFLGMIPVFVISANVAPLGIFDLIGALVALGGVLIEYISDEQLRKFKKHSVDKNSNMNKGLWSKTRHPNYLGEIIFWLGIFLMALSGNVFQNLWTGSGFIAMVILFRFISIPMMEKRLVERKSGYQDYIKSVPILFPRIF